jgi:hypothetical protein
VFEELRLVRVPGAAQPFPSPIDQRERGALVEQTILLERVHGPWSAALAPVDSSGFVVVVQSPRPQIRSLLALAARVTLELMAPFGFSLALLLAFRVRQSVK